jgi:hypothetical protein
MGVVGPRVDGHAGRSSPGHAGAGGNADAAQYEQQNRSIAEHCRLCYQNLRRFLPELVSWQF